MKTTSKFILAILLLGTLLLPTLAATPALAASAQSEICQGLGQAAGSCSTGQAGTLNATLKVIVDVLSAIAGVVAIIMIVISGLKFITANGDSSNIASARSSLIYALVGLVVVALAQAIVHFVLDRVAG